MAGGTSGLGLIEWMGTVVVIAQQRNSGFGNRKATVLQIIEIFWNEESAIVTG